MSKVKPAGPIALALREWMNLHQFTVEEVNRALVIICNGKLGNGNGRGEGRSCNLGRPAKPTAGKGVNIDDEHCQS
jgi:hypothetical protein